MTTSPTSLAVQVGSVSLKNPVMTASGTAGHGDELSAYFDLSQLGAVVVKSLYPEPWPGNPAPRVHQTPAGMLNSVGLQGPGVEYWKEKELPDVVATGAVVVASIWGSTIDDYARAAEMLRDAPVVAVEVNVSCPNHHDRNRMFSHAPHTTAEAIEASASCGKPLWAKLSPNVADLATIAQAAISAGAEAVTLINTVLGMLIDIETRTKRLGGGGGGLSGPAIHPVAVRAVHDVRAAHPEIPIIGVGGIANGADAIELMMAGANAVQVGTATFADPRAPLRVVDEIRQWCEKHSVRDINEIVGAVHGH
jgi:dihydroorotate dehydrogenase (NAD+) catalytic subunit